MAAPTLCLYNKFGYCKFGERCRKHHISEICQNRSCEINSCRQRHPKVCKYFRDFGRCKFSPFVYKHKKTVNSGKDYDQEIKFINDKMDDLQMIINDKNQQINEMSSKIHDLERKLETQSDVNSLFDSLEEKNFEKKFETAEKKNE